MSKLHPYLTFKGNCEEAFDFYKTVFGGDFAYVGRFSEMPPQEGVELPEEDKNKIMHISLPLSEDHILMGSDSGGEWSPHIVVGNNVSLSVSPETKAEADRIFSGLAAGGKITMPIGATFWGDYFGMCTDRFGINWMVSWNEEKKG